MAGRFSRFKLVKRHAQRPHPTEPTDAAPRTDRGEGAHAEAGRAQARGQGQGNGAAPDGTAPGAAHAAGAHDESRPESGGRRDAQAAAARTVQGQAAADASSGAAAAHTGFATGGDGEDGGGGPADERMGRGESDDEVEYEPRDIDMLEDGGASARAKSAPSPQRSARHGSAGSPARSGAASGSAPGIPDGWLMFDGGLGGGDLVAATGWPAPLAARLAEEVNAGLLGEWTRLPGREECDVAGRGRRPRDADSVLFDGSGFFSSAHFI